LQGDAERAVLSLKTGEQMARAAGVRVIQLVSARSTPITVVPILVNTILGDWDEAEAGQLQIAALTEELRYTPLDRVCANPVVGGHYLERNELGAAKTHLEDAAAFCQAGGDNTPELLCRANLVEVACKTGDLEDAADHLERAWEVFRLSPNWYGLGAEVYHAEGVRATAQQRWPEADAAFQQAVAINQQYHLPYYEARSLLEWGQMYFARNGLGDRDVGIKLLDQAVDIFQRVQAKKMIEKVAALKDGLPAQLPSTYPDGLTRREVEVIRLIAAGKTDREIAGELIISINTVYNHVKNILNKTNVANRTEAASYATRVGLTNAAHTLGDLG